AIGLDVVYLRLGKMTSRLAGFLRGPKLQMWGPLGNGFSAGAGDHLIIGGGGIGETPFMALGREDLWQSTYGGNGVRKLTASERVTMCYGARNKEYLAGVDDFRALGIDLKISTDDGSAGHHGFVTDLLKQTLSEPATGSRRIVCCGPEKM